MIVLFVCSANTCRSVMCEYYFNHLAGKQPGCLLSSFSTGLYACEGEHASSYAVEMLERTGIDARRHHALRMTRDYAESADLIVGMTPAHCAELIAAYPEAAGKVVLLLDELNRAQPSHARGVADPYGCGLDVYSDSFTLLKQATEALFHRLTKETAPDPETTTPTLS